MTCSYLNIGGRRQAMSWLVLFLSAYCSFLSLILTSLADYHLMYKERFTESGFYLKFNKRLARERSSSSSLIMVEGESLVALN